MIDINSTVDDRDALCILALLLKTSPGGIVEGDKRVRVRIVYDFDDMYQYREHWLILC